MAKQRPTTIDYPKLPYEKPLPTSLIRKMAKHQVRVVAEREDDGFW